MSTLKVDAIRSTSGDTDAITLSSTAGVKSINGAPFARNIIRNGAMRVNLRGNASITTEDFAVDRFKTAFGGTDEAPTSAKVALTSSDADPWSEGFRNALQITNGNQSSGAGTSDHIEMIYNVEAQHLANSGWNYGSTSGFVTLSFWVKSSVAQNFFFNLRTFDGTDMSYPFETGTLSANTWTKVEKTIPGHANVEFNNDTGTGLRIQFWLFAGTAMTGSGATSNSWHTQNDGARTLDQTSTWYTTNDATFALTGVQLEVGKTATSFCHKSWEEDLNDCFRYCYIIEGNSDLIAFGYGRANGTTSAEVNVPLPVPIRNSPSITCSNNSAWGPSSSSTTTTAPSVRDWKEGKSDIALVFSGHSGLTNGRCTNVFCASGADLILTSEL